MPHYWLMNNSYDEKWDLELRALMSEHNFTQFQHFYNLFGKTTPGYISKYEARLGDTVVWTTNHPYASFIKTNPNSMVQESKRPSRQTIYIARKKLEKDLKRPGWACVKTARRNKVFKKLGISNFYKNF